MKKKLIIPDKGFTKEQINQMADRNMSICYLVKEQGRIFDGKLGEFPDYPDFCWEEIKQPMTFEEWFKQECMVTEHKEEFEKLYKWTVENERLKHEPKQTFDDWFVEKFHGHEAQDRLLYHRLKACHEWTEKNRGF